MRGNKSLSVKHIVSNIFGYDVEDLKKITFFLMVRTLNF